jgi:ubiquinol-cytochrome c reductase iron-sulfur subunit
VTPAASLGPLLDEELLLDSPWLPGRLLVDEHGSPVRIDELEIGSFVTAFAQDADRRRLDASLVVVRLRPDEVRLPAERADWAPDGVLAFSKVCTHAGCAISLFRYPTFEPTSKQPALVCPCHYSAFDPRTGGEVLYGPAVRALPQLPLIARADGALAARAGLSGPVGPSWWKVRR